MADTLEELLKSGKAEEFLKRNSQSQSDLITLDPNIQTAASPDLISGPVSPEASSIRLLPSKPTDDSSNKNYLNFLEGAKSAPEVMKGAAESLKGAAESFYDFAAPRFYQPEKLAKEQFEKKLVSDFAPIAKETEKVKAEEKKETQENELLRDAVTDFETLKGKDPYTQENEETGAYGRYQVIKKYHENQIKNKLGASWDDFKKSPDLQDRYFNEVLLPEYKKGSNEILEHPKAKELGISREQAIVLQQLGKQNVLDYLEGKEFTGAVEGVPQQIENVLNKTSKFLTERGRTGASIGEGGRALASIESPTEVKPEEVEPKDEISALISKYGDKELKGRLAEIQGLKKAQEGRDLTILLNQLGKSAELIGANLGGLVERGTISKPVATEIYNQNIAQAENIVKDFKENLELQKLAKKEDPKSEESQVARSLLNSLGIKIPENASAAFIEKNFASLSSLAKVKEAAALRKQQQEEKAQEKKVSDARKDLAKRVQIAVVRGGTTFENQKRNITQADSIFNTIGVPIPKTEKDVDKISEKELNTASKPQIAEIALELSKLLTGTGVSNQKTFSTLFPNTIGMDAASLSTYFTNKLGPSQQASFLKIAMKTAVRQKELAKRNMLAQQKQLFSGTKYLRSVLGEDYDDAISGVTGIDKDEIEGFISSSDAKKQEPKETKEEKDPAVRDYADKHFKGDYEAAKKFLIEKRGYGK